MNPIIVAPYTCRLPAAVAVESGGDRARGYRCRVVCREGIIDAWTWMDLAGPNVERTHHGTASILPLGTAPDTHLLVGFTADSYEPLGNILPDDLCPIPDVVRHTTSLVDQLCNEPLRDFVVRALLRVPALTHFWICPASRADHHAYSGGLAEHSLDVALAVSTAHGLPRIERELGIVYALLHDYGKLWWLDPTLRDPQEHRSHEVLGRARLQTDLDELRHDDPILADTLDELLGGPSIPRSTRYPLAIRKVVQAFDQMSCEKTRDLPHRPLLADWQLHQFQSDTTY